MALMIIIVILDTSKCDLRLQQHSFKIARQCRKCIQPVGIRFQSNSFGTRRIGIRVRNGLLHLRRNSSDHVRSTIRRMRLYVVSPLQWRTLRFDFSFKIRLFLQRTFASMGISSLKHLILYWIHFVSWQ